MRTLLAAGIFFSFSPFLQAASDSIAPPDDAETQAAVDSAASQSLTAAQLWAQIEAEGQTLMAGLQKHDIAVIRQIPRVQSDLDLYLSKFSADAHVPAAKLMLVQVHDLARGLQLPGAESAAAVNQEFAELANDTTLPNDLRAEASLMAITSLLRNARADEAAQEAAGKGHSAQWDEVEAKVSDFEKNFGTLSFDGKTAAVTMLRAEQLRLLQDSGDTARLNALLAKLASDPHPELAALAKQATADAQAAADLKTKPLDLKFTALDGSAVDLASMRGKVVLIDFWATWCPPAIGELPDILTAYQKYHGQGFEIVGISLDQDKSALEAFIKARGMTWPQYFDGKGWDNAISSRMGIQAIPAMWLVGKDGMVATQDGRQDLAGQVQNLLQAK